MQQDDIMKMLESVITGFSYILGSDTEIALHDLKKRELYAIVNGYITGRESGHKMHPSVYDTVLEMAPGEQLCHRLFQPYSVWRRSACLPHRDQRRRR